MLNFEPIPVIQAGHIQCVTHRRLAVGKRPLSSSIPVANVTAPGWCSTGRELRIFKLSRENWILRGIFFKKTLSSQVLLTNKQTTSCLYGVLRVRCPSPWYLDPVPVIVSLLSDRTTNPRAAKSHYHYCLPRQKLKAMKAHYREL